MKLVKSLLLGSAAGLCAVAGAQAADLPVKKAVAVEYVRVCTAFGAGFFFIPGTDTCLRISGRARFEYQYTQQNTRASSVSGYRSLARIGFDARTATPYGTLRTFVRLDLASRTGGYLKSGTQERFANAFAGTGADTVREIQKFVEVDSAFIQFAGFTAGRATSFYDFYSGNLELIGAGVYSVATTNLLAYTATFGQGFSATISMEDPSYRRNVIFHNVAAGTTGFGGAGGAPAAQNGVNFATGAFPIAFVPTTFNALGVPTTAVGLDVGQSNYMPDFVGALRYDAAWGSAQLSAAVHEIRTRDFRVATPFAVNGFGGALPAPGTVAARLPDAAYGFAVQGGIKINLPMLAPGDQLWLQGAYGEGATHYTGVFNPTGTDSLTGAITNRFQINQVDAVVDNRSRLRLTESFSVSGAFLHYWSPEWRQAVFGTYGQVNYDPRLRRNDVALVNNGVQVINGGNPFNATLRSYDIFYGGSNLIWSPVKDLDIGVEVVYQRIWLPNRVADVNRGGAAAITGTTVTGTGRTTTFDDNILARFRVQRDF